MGLGWSGADSVATTMVGDEVLAAGRGNCYKARDVFFKCVDDSKATPTETGNVGLLYPSDCKHARAQFEKMCRPSWVRHFDNQYCTQKRLKRLLEKDGQTGPITLPQTA